MYISKLAIVVGFLRDGVLRIFRADHPVRPLEQLVAVFVRHSEELGDRFERQLSGDIGDEVDLAVILRRAPAR